MDLFWDKTAWDDYMYWIDKDRKVFGKINLLIKECQRTPFSGSGNPEPLKQNLSGFWSRRITGEHRLVYKIDEDVVFIAQCRYHY
jgi:toxin YoeB